MFAAGAEIAVEDDQMLDRIEVLQQLCLERRYLRDTSDPFNLDPEYFWKLYRLPPYLAIDLVNRLHNWLIPTKVDGVPPHLQVLCALRFYGEGAYQKGHPVSQTMVIRIIERVTNAIVVMADEFIQFPSTRQDRQRCAQE